MKRNIAALVVLGVAVIVSTAASTWAPLTKSVMFVPTNGNVLFDTNANTRHAFTRGGSNFVVWDTNRTEVYQPWYFALSAQSATSYGTEILSNTGFELTSSTVFSNWVPSVNYGGVSRSANAHAGTNSALIVSSAINALSFGGSDYFKGSTNAKSGGYGFYQYAMEAWVYPTAWPATKGVILSKVYPLGYLEDGYRAPSINELYVNSTGYPVLRMKAYYDNKYTCGTALVLNQWTHIAVSCTNNISNTALLATWYFDGQPVSTNSGGMDNVYDLAAGWSVGYSDYYTNYGFSGMLSDVRVWRSARSESQVLTNYTQRLTGSESGLLNYWPLDEGSGTLLDDKVSVRVDGAFAAAPNAPSWTSLQNYIGSESVVVPGGTNLLLQFYSSGDGVSPGSYAVFEPLLGTWLLSERPIGDYGTNWSLTSTIVSTPTNAQRAQVIFYGATSGGTYFDDVSLRAVDVETNIWALAANCLARIGDDLYYGGKLLLQPQHTGMSVTNWTNYNGGMNGGVITNVIITGATISNSTYGLTGTNVGIVHYDGTNLQASLTPIWYVTNSPYKWISHTLYVSNIVVTNLIQVPTVLMTNLYGSTIELDSSMQASNVFATNVTGSVLKMTNYAQVPSLYFTNATGSTVSATTVNATDVNTSTMDASVSLQAPSGTLSNLFIAQSANMPGAEYDLAWIPGTGISIQTNVHWNMPNRFTNDSISIGRKAGLYIVNSNNIAIGQRALYGITNVEGNIAIGKNAGIGATLFGVQQGTNKSLMQATNGNVNANFTTQFTIEYWAYNTNGITTGHKYGIHFWYSSSSSLSIYFNRSYPGDPLEFVLSMDGITGDIDSFALSEQPTNTWTHYAMTAQMTGAPGAWFIKATLYIDGLFAGETAWIDAMDIFDGELTSCVFPCAYRIAGLRIWNYARSLAEIRDNRYLILDASYSSSLIHSWPITRYVDHSGTYELIDIGATPTNLVVNSTYDLGWTGPVSSSGSMFLLTDLFLQFGTNGANNIFIGNETHNGTTNILTNAVGIGYNAAITANNTVSLGSTNVPMGLMISELTANQHVMTDATRRLISTNIAFSATNTYNITNEAFSTNVYFITNSTYVTNVYYETNEFSLTNQYYLTNLYSLTNEYSLTNLYNLTNEYNLTNSYSITNEYALTNEYYLTNLYSLTNEYALTNEYSLTNSYSITNEYALTNQYYLTNLYSLTNQYALTNEYFSTNIYNLTNAYALTNYYNTTNVYNVTNESGISGSGSDSYLAKWSGTTELASSVAYDTGDPGIQVQGLLQVYSNDTYPLKVGNSDGGTLYMYVDTSTGWLSIQNGLFLNSGSTGGSAAPNLTTNLSANGFMKVYVGGAEKWIPYYNAP